MIAPEFNWMRLKTYKLTMVSGGEIVATMKEKHDGVILFDVGGRPQKIAVSEIEEAVFLF